MAAIASVASFNGAATVSPAVVRAHLVLGPNKHAAYPVLLYVVDSSPCEILLGLNFIAQYCRALPTRMKGRIPVWEVTKLCLGVPKGRGISYPDAVKNLPVFADTAPADMVYKQVLDVDPEAVKATCEGRTVPAEEAVSFLNAHRSILR